MWVGRFLVRCLSSPDTLGQRTVLWESTIANSLADEGEMNVLDVYLRDQNAPSTFFVKLFNDTPVETDSLKSLSGEPGGGVGYAPQQVLRSASTGGWQLAMVGGNAQARSPELVYRPAGTWNVLSAVLATSSDNNGRLIAYGLLPQARTLTSGESLTVVYLPTLS